MPTKPIQDFIPREIENTELLNILNKFSGIIEEVVNFGSRVFKLCFEAATGKDENIPIFLSFRHIFELADSISLLIKQSCIDPCKIYLRAIFESLLSIEYILEENTKQRAMNFLVYYYHQELKFYRRWDPDDQVCREFRAKLKEDKVLKEWKITDLPNVKDGLETRKKILELPHYAESEKEYQSLRKRGIKNPNWYSLHDGPKYLYKLAEHLKRQGFYEILYRQWSMAVHGTDIIRGKVSADELGKAQIWQIRSPKAAQEITQHTINFALTTIRIFVKYFAPEKLKEVSKWYENEIRDYYLSLVSRDIIEVK